MSQTQITQVTAYLERVRGMEEKIPAFIEQCVKDLAQELLRRVRDNTPVSENETIRYYGAGGKILEKKITGGELRRGWTAGRDMDEAAFINIQKVEHSGGAYMLTIENNVEYSVFVEYGHRQESRFVPFLGDTDDEGVRTGAMLSNKWVPGKFMLRISAAQVEKMTPAYLEAMLRDWITGALEL